MTQREAIEFRGYLKNCTDAQVLGVWTKEAKAERWDYAAMAEYEMELRAERKQRERLECQNSLR